MLGSGALPGEPINGPRQVCSGWGQRCQQPPALTVPTASSRRLMVTSEATPSPPRFFSAPPPARAAHRVPVHRLQATAVLRNSAAVGSCCSQSSETHQNVGARHGGPRCWSRRSQRQSRWGASEGLLDSPRSTTGAHPPTAGCWEGGRKEEVMCATAEQR